ncbi:hypothetical protein B4145_0922 [Bacillus subtilis]|nr:hypothetical protein B4145_0922 [Bacillus subtilis]
MFHVPSSPLSHFRLASRKRFLLTAKKTAVLSALPFLRKRFLKRWFHFTLPLVYTQYVFWLQLS